MSELIPTSAKVLEYHSSEMRRMEAEIAKLTAERDEERAKFVGACEFIQSKGDLAGPWLKVQEAQQRLKGLQDAVVEALKELKERVGKEDNGELDVIVATLSIAKSRGTA